jgi:hypothetical protein
MSCLRVPKQEPIVRMTSPPPPLELCQQSSEEESGYVAEFEESPFVYDIYTDVTMQHLIGDLTTVANEESDKSLSFSIPKIFIEPPSPAILLRPAPSNTVNRHAER